MSSVVQLSLNPPLNAAFDLVPPGSSSSVGSAALHPDAIIDAIDPGGSSAGVWEDHELASDFPDDAPLVIADELLHRWVASLIELLDLESPTELLDLESPIELLDLESPIELADGVVPSAATVMGYPWYLGAGGRMWRRSSARLLGNGGL
jgi:hypothetical protein